MITRVNTVGVCVTDQDRSKDLYVKTLGFELPGDDPIAPPGSPRWVEVGPGGSGAGLVLFTPPGSEARVGTSTGYVLACDDMAGTRRAMRAAGVTLTEEPTQQRWERWPQFQDVDGNTFGMVERPARHQ